MVPANDKHQAPANVLKLYVRAGLTHRRAIEEETKDISREYVHNKACRLSHDIHVVSHSFITLNNLFILLKLLFILKALLIML